MTYAGTKAPIEIERGVKRALQLNAFLLDVPYPRYSKRTDRK